MRKAKGFFDGQKVKLSVAYNPVEFEFILQQAKLRDYSAATIIRDAVRWYVGNMTDNKQSLEFAIKVLEREMNKK